MIVASLLATFSISVLCSSAVNISGVTPALSEQEVHFPGADGLTLYGTLLMPSASFSGPRPAVLLLPGSGPTDRDGNSGMLPLKIDLLKQIATGLASRGIASLRFDKRAIQRYKETWPKDPVEMGAFFDWNKFTGDAEGAYRFLCHQPGIASRRVSLCGHSEGGLITLQLAHDMQLRDDAPPAIVLLSTTGRPMGPVIHDQLVRALGKAPLPEETKKSWLDYSDRACADLAAGKPLPPGAPPQLASLFNPTTVPIMSAYCRIDPTHLAHAYKGKVLIVNGLDDTQVNPDKDAKALDAALRTRTVGTVELCLVPSVSHNYKSTSGGNPDAMEGPASPIMLNAVEDFLSQALKAE